MFLAAGSADSPDPGEALTADRQRGCRWEFNIVAAGLTIDDEEALTVAQMGGRGLGFGNRSEG